MITPLYHFCFPFHFAYTASPSLNAASILIAGRSRLLFNAEGLFNVGFCGGSLACGVALVLRCNAPFVPLSFCCCERTYSIGKGSAFLLLLRDDLPPTPPAPASALAPAPAPAQVRRASSATIASYTSCRASAIPAGHFRRLDCMGSHSQSTKFPVPLSASGRISTIAMDQADVLRPTT